MTDSAPMPRGSTAARLRLKLAAAVAIAFAAVAALVIGAGFAVWSRIPDDLRSALRRLDRPAKAVSKQSASPTDARRPTPT